MSQQAISLMGNSAILTTNAAPNTNTSVPVPISGAANLALGSQPPNIRLLNKGTADIWLSFTSPASVAAVIPTAGTATLGTPQPVIWIAPGIEIVISLPCGCLALTGVTGTPVGFWINNISSAASQNFQFQLGDGL